MKIHHYYLGSLETHCYLAEDGETAVLIDVGGEASEVLEDCRTHNLKLTAILLTHGHFDHIEGVNQVVNATGATVYVHKADASKLQSAELSLAKGFHSFAFSPVTEYQTFQDGDSFTFGNMTFSVMHTPGHSEGSCCFFAESHLFSGDTLFREGIGRTDFHDGDSEKMKNSLIQLGNLKQNYKVYPGHGDTTELDWEKENNSYLKFYMRRGTKA